MAFNAENLARWSPYNLPGPVLFGYHTTVDDVATVSGATYFRPFADSLNQSLLPSPFSVGDTIQCTCTDGLVDINITSINPITSGAETVTVIIGPNSVNTAAIQDLAVTTGKINDLAVTTGKINDLAVTAGKIANATITTTQISGTAGITGAQIAATTVAAANIANATITGAKIAATTVAGSNMIANTVASGQLDLTTIQYVKVPVTAAQFNAMYGAPFIMIAAPGANKMIVVKQSIYAMTFVAAQYVAGGTVALQYDSTAHGAGTLASATVANTVVQGYAASSSVGVAGAQASAAITTTVNKGLYLSNDTAAFTTGDGTWNIHIWYEIVTL